MKVQIGFSLFYFSPRCWDDNVQQIQTQTHTHIFLMIGSYRLHIGFVCLFSIIITVFFLRVVNLSNHHCFSLMVIEIEFSFSHSFYEFFSYRIILVYVCVCVPETKQSFSVCCINTVGPWNSFIHSNTVVRFSFIIQVFFHFDLWFWKKCSIFFSTSHFHRLAYGPLNHVLHFLFLFGWLVRKRKKIQYCISHKSSGLNWLCWKN